MPLKLKKIISCPMKDILTKRKTNDKKKENDQVHSDVDEDQDNDFNVVNSEFYKQDPDLIQMRKTIEKDPEMFILNNLMMCVQFFQNFEEEIKKIRETLILSREKEFNDNLLPQKRTLLPDVLQENIGRHLKFTSPRQTLRPTIEPLQPIRVYVIHENMEIGKQNESHNYTTMNDDTVMYNLLLKPSDHKGYAFLQHLGLTPLKKNVNIDMELSSIVESNNEYYDTCLLKYNDNESELRDRHSMTQSYSSRSLPEMTVEENDEISVDKRDSQKDSSSYRLTSDVKAELNQKEQSPASSTSSGYVTSRYSPSYSYSEYGHSGPGSISDSYKNAELPESCFKMVTYTQSGNVYNPKEDRRQNLTSKQKRIKDQLRRYNYNVWYINSGAFTRYFFKVFKQQLAESLCFDKAAVEDAKCLGPVVYCDKIEVIASSMYTKVEPYEIIPSVWTQWPDCSKEWLVRERGGWPDYEVVEKIKDFGCYLIPESFASKSECNPWRKIEWELTFPAAERYLETCMSHSQTRVFLVALMLHKSFVRPVDTLLGLTTSHIRNKLFWLIEQNGSQDWPEYSTGERLIKLLSSLYQCISQNPPLLKDYFLKEKNLFQNIPNECLLQSQKQINRILNNPVMYLIYAMDNIQHDNAFFPRLNIEQLLQILTVDIVSLLNPQLAQRLSKPMSRANKCNYTDELGISRISSWNESNSKKDNYQTSQKSVTCKTLFNVRGNTKNPIVEISVRCAEMEKLRICQLLDFFTRHFIKTAERYHQYKAWKQKAVFLAHAERLCVLLSENEISKKYARVHMQTITAMKEVGANANSNTDSSTKSPEMSKRNSDKPLFSTNYKLQFTYDMVNQNHLQQLLQVPESQINCNNSSITKVDIYQARDKVEKEISEEKIESIVNEKIKEDILEESSENTRI